MPVVLVASAACSVDLTVPEGATLRCAATDECPADYECDDRTGTCLLRGTHPVEQALALSLPRAGDTNVSTTAPLLVAFVLPVDVVSVSERASLSDGARTIGILEVTKVDDRSLLVEHDELPSLAQVTLRFAAGVRPASPQLGLPSLTEIVIDFTAGERPDRVAPAPVTAVVVDQTDVSHATISWAPPLDDDWAGVLVLRKTSALLDDERPAPGVSYAAEARIGDATVAAVLFGESAEIAFPAGSYDWAFFAMDDAANYSEPTSVPFVTGLSVTWCPATDEREEIGTFLVSSSDAGSSGLLVSGRLVPALPLPALGAVVPFGAGDVPPGATYNLRAVAYDSAAVPNTYMGPPQSFVASATSLEPVIPVTPEDVALGTGATAVMGFNPFAWPAFEAAVDTDASAGLQSYTAAATHAGDTARALMDRAGSFRLAVRPVVPGCATAKWAESPEFVVGAGVRYVSQANGSDANDGKSRLTPYATLAKAHGDANGSEAMDILIAEGTYDEGLDIKPQVRLFGGYASDFLSQDGALLGAAPRLHETKLTGVTPPPFTAGIDCYSTIYVGPGRTGVVIDSLTLWSPDGANSNNCAVYIQGGAAATVTNCHLRGARAATNKGIRGVQSFSGTVTLEGNLVEAKSLYAGSYSTGVAFVTPATDGTPVIRNNLFRTSVGLTMARGTFPLPIVEDNVFAGYDEPGAPVNAGATGVECVSGHSLQMRRNVIRQGRPWNNNDTSTGLAMVGGCSGLVEHNIIDGGGGHYGSLALWLSGGTSTPLRIINNLLSAGSGMTHQRLIAGDNNAPTVILAHNTCLVGTELGPSYPISRRYALELYSGAGYGPRIINNLFFAPPGMVWSFWHPGTGPYPQAVQNNVMTPPASYLHMDAGNEVIYDWTLFLDHMCNTRKVRTTGNMVTSLPLEQIFVSVGGADGDVATLGDNDWSILAGAQGELRVGLDTSQDLCAGGEGTADACTGAGTGDCGDVAEDYAGVGRPAVPTVGAYEP
ncbi:MAG: right-handed parallel beta-helix repeat-containing protein [Deltaproteobacteria bacterium]|nr:right-handed parallel beta-helix repeat-containing protein [Deltaproteobacteria bacterium]